MRRCDFGFGLVCRERVMDSPMARAYTADESALIRSVRHSFVRHQANRCNAAYVSPTILGTGCCGRFVALRSDLTSITIGVVWVHDEISLLQINSREDSDWNGYHDMRRLRRLRYEMYMPTDKGDKRADLEKPGSDLEFRPDVV